MNVLILGFDGYEEIDEVMEKLIQEKECYLFNVIVSGRRESEQLAPSEEWAMRKGAPRYYVYDEDVDKLMWRIEQVTDYVVIKVGDRTPQWQKNLMMRLKTKGVHGTCIVTK